MIKDIIYFCYTLLGLCTMIISNGTPSLVFLSITNFAFAITSFMFLSLLERLKMKRRMKDEMSSM